MEKEFDAALDQGPVLTLDPFMDKGLETEQGKEER